MDASLLDTLFEVSVLGDVHHLLKAFENDNSVVTEDDKPLAYLDHPLSCAKVARWVIMNLCSLHSSTLPKNATWRTVFESKAVILAKSRDSGRLDIYFDPANEMSVWFFKVASQYVDSGLEFKKDHESNWSLKIETKAPLYSPDVLPAIRHIALLGEVGHGKSSLGNLLLDGQESKGIGTFVTARSTSGVTTTCLTQGGPWATYSPDITLLVTDTPGVNDSQKSDDEVLQDIATTLLNFIIGGKGLGVALFCICLRADHGRVTNSLLEMLKKYAQLLGLEFWDHAVLVVTRCDPRTEQEDIQDQLHVIKRFPQTFKSKFSCDLKVFATSVRKDPTFAECGNLAQLKADIKSKTTVYRAKFFRAVYVAYCSGGYGYALQKTITILKNAPKQ